MESLRGFEKIAPFLTEPLVLVGFGLLVVLGFFAGFLRSRKVPPLGPRSGARVVRQVLRFGFVLAVLVLIGGFGLALRESYQIPDVYRVRLTVLDRDGAVVDDGELSSSVGGDFQPGIGIWELVVPVSAVPADRRIEVRGRKGAAAGSVAVMLEKDFQPVATLQLVTQEVTVRGIVVDTAGRPLSGVRVTVLGYPNEAVVTPENGSFELPAHAGDGEWVRLRAEKEGYRAAELMHMAGEHPARLELEAMR